MTLTMALKAAADSLDEHADELTRLDAIAGDGDLGVTAGKVAQAIRQSVEAADSTPADLLNECGRNIALSAASSCGTLLASAFMAASKVVGQGQVHEQIAAALDAAAEGVMKRGKAVPGDKTLIDALMPAAQAAHARTAADSWANYLQNIADAAQAGVESTRTMKPRVGRARSQPDRAVGHPDAGSVLVTVAMSAALKIVAEANSADFNQLGEAQ
jgi:phosphoenolpyruvate---glycerone phosphotransferase subunit DhaL